MQRANPKWLAAKAAEEGTNVLGGIGKEGAVWDTFYFPGMCNT